MNTALRSACAFASTITEACSSHYRQHSGADESVCCHFSDLPSNAKTGQSGAQSIAWLERRMACSAGMIRQDFGNSLLMRVYYCVTGRTRESAGSAWFYAAFLLNSRGMYSMPNTFRLMVSSLALVTIAACSRSADQPALPDDLKKDLASVGGGDVQLAGMATPRLDVVSADERTKSPTPAPKSPTVSRAPSAFHGTRAAVKSVRHDTPAPAQADTKAAEVAPAEVPQVERAPEPAPAAQGRPEAPRPSTQREPRGGWKTPGQIIRGAPFPINP
jgi:hypothetical protein